nr:CDP-diacylglycerol--serine O-phosphatidyltransferase [Penaeicola halotolerans]
MTCCNLFSGFMGIIFVANYDLVGAAVMIWVAAGFDFLDGFAARLLNAQSPIGKDLDSLADAVTFGVLPAFIMFTLLDKVALYDHVALVAGLIAVASVVRLAKFNHDERQSDRFIGLPTPANALLISGLPFLMEQSTWWRSYLERPDVLVFLILSLSYLLLAQLPLIALKFKSFALKPNIFRYLLIVLSIGLGVIGGVAALPAIILLYLVLSMIENIVSKNKAV